MPETLQIRTGEKPASLAYVLKGYPRLSETFISSEIYRMELAGVPLRIYVVKPSDEISHHPTVDRIQAKPVYLPRTSSLKETHLFTWLRRHLRAFTPGLWRTFRRRPAGVMRAALAAFAQAVRARRSSWAWPRKVYLKEFLQAATLSDHLLQAPEVRHMHAHFCHGVTTVTWLVSIMTGLSFSFTAHAKDLYSPSLNPAGLLQRKMDAASFVVTCTENNRDFLQKVGSKTSVHCVYHGLNADFSRLLKQTEPGNGRNGHLRALAVGRLVPKKGFDIFVEACAILRQRRIDFEALIVGESGEHETVIRNLIAAHGLGSHIHLTGPMSQAMLFREYQQATTFCLPCRVLDNGDRDGIPNVLVEAMACGLPVISTTVSGIPEAVRHEETGLLIPAEDAVALADSLVRLQQDRGLARRLSQAARRTVSERFDGDKFAGHLANYFREALA
jgi:glycosyltransferase involved in cell wall biosynthesis